MKIPRLLHCIGLAAAALLPALRIQAAPYASGCTNSGGTIQYYLNSSPGAGNVQITTYPSLAHPANTPATPAQGLNSFSIGSDTSYTITVSQSGSGSPSAESIATANTPNLNWGGSPDPRGMDVNADPTNGPAFGTVYMANGAAGTGHGLGLFPTHSDMSFAFGASTAGLDSATFTGGAAGSAPYKLSVSRYDGSVIVSAIDPTVGTVYALNPYLQSSSVVQLLPKGQNTTGTAVSPYHGEIYGTPKSTGTLAGGNFVLYTFDYTMPTPATVDSTFGGMMGAIGLNSAYYLTNYEYNATSNPNGPITHPGGYANLNRYTIGSAANAPWAHLPDLTLNYGLASVPPATTVLPGDMEVGVDGKLFTTSERASAGSAPYLSVWDPAGQTNLWCSQGPGPDDLVRDQIEATGYDGGAPQGCLIRASADGKYIAMLGYYCYIAIYKLTNGIPDLSTFTFIPDQTNSGGARGIAWDMADNVYAMDSGSGVTKIFDLGLSQICTTSNDLTSMNGSFQITTPPSVTVAATTPIGYQANNSYAMNGATASPAVFTLTMSPIPSVATTVNFVLSSTSVPSATNGTTYTASSSSSVTFPAGSGASESQQVTITPAALPAVGPSYSVTLTISGSSSYNATSPTAATISIANSGTPTLLINGTGAPSMYRPYPNDFVSFALTRWGDTNVSFTVPFTDFTPGGTAVYGTDYIGGPQAVNYTTAPTTGYGSGSLSFTPGSSVQYVEVGLPMAHMTYTGNETITIAGATGGSTYAYGADTAVATLLDNLNPPENVIWSDPLTSQTDSTNWGVAFSQNGGQYPYQFYTPDYNNMPSSSENFDADFGYGTGLSGGVTYDFVPLPPDGADTVLRLTVNKLTSGNTGAAGVNLYPLDCPVLSGNYAVRFSMYCVRGCDEGGSTEAVMFGINHYGTNVTWWLGDSKIQTNAIGPIGTFSFTNADGLSFVINADPGQQGTVGGYGSDFLFLTATNSGGANKYFPSTGYWTLNGASWTSYTNIFKSPLDFSEADYGFPASGGYYLDGVPFNESGWAADSYSSGSCPPSGVNTAPPAGGWTDVEMKQSNNVVTLSLNKTVIFTYNNVTPFTNGYPMLGYMDPFSGAGVGGGVYFSDIRAIELSPSITNKPVNLAVGAGTNAVFTVGAIGSAPFTNQWYFGTNLIPANLIQTTTVSAPTDSDTLTIPSAMPSEAGIYTLVVSDASGVPVSTTFTLTVGFAPMVSITPATVSTYVGATVNFLAATVSGTTPFTYSWVDGATTLANAGQFAGTTTSNLTITSVVVTNSGTYTVTAHNAYGTNAASVALTVLAAPSPNITNITVLTNGVKLGYNVGDPYDTTNSYTIQGSTNLSTTNPPEGFTNVTPVPLFQTNGGTNFTVTVTNVLKPAEYFRLLHK